MSSHPTDIHSRLWSRQNIRLSRSSIHCREKSPNRLDSHSPVPCDNPRDRDNSSQNNSACPLCRTGERLSTRGSSQNQADASNGKQNNKLERVIFGSTRQDRNNDSRRDKLLVQCRPPRLYGEGSRSREPIVD